MTDNNKKPLINFGRSLTTEEVTAINNVDWKKMRQRCAELDERLAEITDEGLNLIYADEE